MTTKGDILKKHIEFKKTSVHFEPKLKDIKRYLELFFNSSKKPLDKFEESDLINFVNFITTKYSIRTTNDIKTYLKVFIKWYYKDYSLRFRNLDKICRQQKAERSYEPEQMLSIKEVKKLIKAEKDLMYKVYWVVFFYGGFRPSEACSLKWENVFFEKEGVILKLHATKTGRDFYKSLPLEAEHLLKEWRKYNSSEWVFPSPIKEGECIKARSICGRLKRLSQRTLKRKVVPYQLRHSIATILYQDDSRKDDLTANQLGHNKSMKEVYQHLNEDILKAKARSVWIKPKPLSPKEKTELEKIKKQLEFLEKENKKTKKNLKKSQEQTERALYLLEYLEKTQGFKEFKKEVQSKASTRS